MPTGLGQGLFTHLPQALAFSALAEERATFEAIRDRARSAMARELLTLTTLPVEDAALTLAFATPGAFVRAFHRWTSRTLPEATRSSWASVQ